MTLTILFLHCILLILASILHLSFSALLSRAVTDGGGSVTESRMVRLGDEFIIVMHVAVPFELLKSIQNKIRNTKSLQPLNVKCSNISRRKTGTYQTPMSGVRIRCVGADK